MMVHNTKISVNPHNILSYYDAVNNQILYINAVRLYCGSFAKTNSRNVFYCRTMNISFILTHFYATPVLITLWNSF